MRSKGIDYLTIKDLLSNKDRYMIPLYQRNYSWGKDEIEQLINDIYIASNLNKNYYIGSLVVYKDREYYEVIDGQQRLTTINILNAAFYKINNINYQLGSNLSFSHRVNSELSLKSIYGKDLGHLYYDKFNNIEFGYDFAVRKLEEIKENDADGFNLFLDLFFNKVLILRTEVLPETDLNHYFEIMNSRGEQLEQHEVLKAHFMSKFTEGMGNKDNDSIKAQALFGNIWDACSDMERNVVMGFSPGAREKLFFETKSKYGENQGKYLENFKCKNFNEILSKLEEQNIKEVNGAKNIIDILEKEIFSPKNSNEVQEEIIQENTSSIINFSNFLMHALKAYKKDKQSEIELDDKKLIFTFKEFIKTRVDVEDFIFFLLRIRLCFDKYIIKYTKSSNEDWSLKTAYLYTNKGNKSVQYIDTFLDGEQGKIKLLLSMFQTVYTTKNYKNWLFSILNGFINENWDTNNYISNLEILAKKTAKDSDELDKGTKVRHFIFNYLDYLLYKKYKDKSILAYLPEQKIRHDKFNELESYFDKFRFSYRHSIEHCYAQNLNKDEDLGYIEKGVKVIDSFGNLCLIEADFNSSLSDNTIPLKREKLLELLRKNRDRSASLKQVIMLMYDDNCWSSQSAKKTIEEHGKRMKELLNESFNS